MGLSSLAVFEERALRETDSERQERREDTIRGEFVRRSTCLHISEGLDKARRRDIVQPGDVVRC